LQILSLSTSNFRNLEAGTISFSRRANLIGGANGQGKTNLLEALCVLGNLRSFRGASPRTMVCHGEAGFRLAAELVGPDGRRTLEQHVTVGPPTVRKLLVDGRAAALAEYLTLCPVFSLSSADDQLVLGPPRHRRAYLDRLAFLLEPKSLAEIRRYQRALRQRNAALSAGATDDALAAWEKPLAAAAANIVVTRRRALESVRSRVLTIYRESGGEGFPELTLAYLGEGWLKEEKLLEILEKSYETRYNQSRARDRNAGHTLEGPHRHDLRLLADGRPVRDVLSSGQTKVAAAALRLASVVSVEEDRGDRFPLVMDDVDAELDNAVLRRLTGALDDGRQLFLSSARPEPPLDAAAETLSFELSRGHCQRRTAAGE
jgi:DNA replication and repair protein RecF